MSDEDKVTRIGGNDENFNPYDRPGENPYGVPGDVSPEASDNPELMQPKKVKEDKEDKPPKKPEHKE